MAFHPKFTIWPIQLDGTTIQRVGKRLRAIGSGVVWGAISGNINLQTDLMNRLVNKITRNPPITPNTKTKITYNHDGVILSGADATTADITVVTDKNYVTDANLIDIGSISGKVTANAPIAPGTATKISYGANGLVTGSSAATTADIADSTDKRYCTDAEKIAISSLPWKKRYQMLFTFPGTLSAGTWINPPGRSGAGWLEAAGYTIPTGYKIVGAIGSIRKCVSTVDTTFSVGFYEYPSRSGSAFSTGGAVKIAQLDIGILAATEYCISAQTAVLSVTPTADREIFCWFDTKHASANAEDMAITLLLEEI